MLIVFDLDDTLIDTSGCVTPIRLREMFDLVWHRGACPESYSLGLEALFKLNAESSNSKEAIRALLNQYGATQLFEEALALYTAPLPPDFPILPTPDAKKVLQVLLEKGHRLAIVTGGKKTFQLEKLEKAGFEPSIFSKIVVPEDSIKKPHYEALLREFSELPSDCVAVGDRPLLDLLPAHELGLRTVHMRWGRGRRGKNETWIDYSIHNLSELLEFLV